MLTGQRKKNKKTKNGSVYRVAAQLKTITQLPVFLVLLSLHPPLYTD